MHAVRPKHFPALCSVILAFAATASAEDLHSFKVIQLNDQFWSEGATFGDLNNDKVNDIISGPWWWEGPDFKKRREIYPAKAIFKRRLGPQTAVTVPGFEGALGVANKYSDNFFAYVHDFNADGWKDVLIIGFPGKETSWFENPKGAETPWKRHVIFTQTDNESPTFTDLTGDGKPELVCITQGRYGYASPDWKSPEKPWAFRPITPDKKYGNFTHGMGVGDVNSDGRMDLLEKDGWWEQPATLEGDPVWTFHPVRFSRGGAQMYAYDVNGDGLNDVITSLSAHAFGLAWHEQLREGGFREHIIMGKHPQENRYGVKFSELHALDLVDMDGDGLKDIVTGKRFWSHGRVGDPDRNDTAVIYWFQLVLGPDKSVDFVPHLIHDDSGVGTQVVTGDVNGDGLPDVVVGNKKGTFVMLHEKKAVSREQWEKAQPKPIVQAKPPTTIIPKSDDGRDLNLGFESGTLQDWTATGTAFKDMPVKGDAVNRRRSDMTSGHRGDFWVGTYETAGDGETGTLTSTAFTVTQPFASCLVGGGSGGKTRVEIVNAANGHVLFRATGPDDEKMRAVAFDLRPYAGTRILVRVVDEATSGWGHVNFDDFIFHDAPPLNAEEIPPAPISASLPERADLRSEFARFGLAQRLQGKRGTCSVFTTVEALEFAVSRATGRGVPLSVEFANWAANAATGRKDDGDFFHHIIRGIAKHGICTEATLPYAREFSPTLVPPPQAIEEASRFLATHQMAFHWIRPWDRKPGLNDADLRHIKEVLASGSPVCAGSYHSILFVGYEDNATLPGGGRFHVTDSNGKERDLTYEDAKKRMCDLFWVSVASKGS